MSGGLRSGQVAEAAGVDLQTLRYYERRGPLAEPDRTLGGHRLYPAEAVTVLRVIKTAQRLGFTLEEVASLLETTAHHHGRRPAGLRERAVTKLAEVEQRTLQTAVEAGCDDLVACAGEPCCPLPFAELTHPETDRSLLLKSSATAKSGTGLADRRVQSKGRGEPGWLGLSMGRSET